MHFGFLVEPDKAQPAAIFLADFVKNVRGNLDKALDWQRNVKVGQRVLYVDVEAGALTGRHEDTDVVTVTHDCVLASGKVLEPYDGGFVRVAFSSGNDDLIPAVTILGVVHDGMPTDHEKALAEVKNEPDWIIVDHCLCWRPRSITLS
ncbi:hypothetical protein GS610_08060 [Ruegeria sp. HKCCD6228]|uniref:hypothetical protein n=1 Tax=Ruegeria sp. HKCCD6228 TaxID=2683001 RepID=UPI001490EA0B|nr:hypothetical protein [Ruegeria sp. HKCCD6228]NOD97161.1 hypothetical protein [Ruegeria sp. HKCCD6228]